MSTLTPNLNLVLPIGTEKVSRQIINTNMTLIDTAVGGKINITDIVNNLTTNDPNKPLSAAQGYALNSNLENYKNWTSLGTVAGIGASHYLTLPSGWRECAVKVRDKHADGFVNFSVFVLSYFVTYWQSNYFRFGQTTSFYGTLNLYTDGKICLFEYFRDGTLVPDTTDLEITVYYR